MHLEAFELARGRDPWSSRSRASRRGVRCRCAARAGFALLLAGARGGVPDRARCARRAREPRASRRRRRTRRRERESVLAALRDLEEDFETGKLDAADHAQMRGELRARAAALLAAERTAPAPPVPAAPPAVPACPSCAAPRRAGRALLLELRRAAWAREPARARAG